MRFISRFFKEEDGATTIEALLWLPVFIGLMAATVDVSMVFNAHSRILGVVQDVDRAYSVGRLDTNSDAEDLVRSLLPYSSDSYTVDTTVTNGIIQTTVAMPMRNLVATGFFTQLLDLTLTVRDNRYMES